MGSAVRVIASGAVIGLCVVGGSESPAGDDAVRRPPLDLMTFVSVTIVLIAHGDHAVDCRSGLACGADRSSGGAANRVTRSAGGNGFTAADLA